MKRFPNRRCVVLMALALQVLPAAAAPVAFMATTKGPTPTGEMVPLDPPIVAVVWHSTAQATFKGTSLGEFKVVESFTTRLGVDGQPVSLTGVGVFTGANGDAIFFVDNAVFGPTPQNTWIITGGRGRFAGASGSGRYAGQVDPAKNELTCVFEAMIDAPAFK